MLNEVIFLIANLIFWSSLGATEGFKWTHRPYMVTGANYHLFRGFTNGSVILAFLFPITDITRIISVILIAWPVYELVLNYVNFGNALHQKSVFKIGDIGINYPPFYILPIISIGAIISYVLSFQ